MKPGMDSMRLIDGACIADSLVEASPEQLVAVFGDPVKLAERDKLLVKDPDPNICFFAASWPKSSWSVVEAVGSIDEEEGEGQDYIVTLLRQAAAALEGKVIDLPPWYENGLGVAQLLAREVKARAVCVWGSDEWLGLGGGAELDAAGNIVRACNVSGLEVIARHLAAREKMLAGDDDDDIDDVDEDDGHLVIFTPGEGLVTKSQKVIKFLDGWFKELGVAQPTAPPSLWGEWQGYAEVWGAGGRCKTVG